jgi:hypothetical protein
MISRAELAELYREDDRLRAEHREWLAERQAQAQALVQRNSGDAGLVLKTTDNTLLPAPQSEPEPFDEEPFVFTGPQFDCLAAALDAALAHEADRTRAERDQAIAPLQRELDYLRGQLDAVLGMLGKSLRGNSPEVKDADVIDLPSGILRRRNDAA